MIFDDSDQVVALDTNIARELCYTRPQWVETFIQMRGDGYHFCLSDVLISEFIHQFESGRITAQEFKQSTTCLHEFISPKLPILPGKRQLYLMSNVQDNEVSSTETPSFTQGFSVASWTWLLNVSSPEDLSSVVVSFKCDGKRYQLPFQPGVAEVELQKERDNWRKFVRHFDQLPKDRLHKFRDEMINNMKSEVDKGSSCSPSMSVRFDLWIKYLLETLIQSTQSVGAYNPDSDRRRNDGIDVLLNMALLIKAFVCTLDDSFISRLSPIDSYQKSWVLTPDALCNAWLSGAHPVTSWP